MINEEWKEMGRQAFQEKKWNRYKRNLKEHLDKEGHSEDKINEAIEQFKLELGQELPEKVEDVNPFKSQDNLLGSIFYYARKRGNLKYESLFTSLDMEDIAIKASINSSSELTKAKNKLEEFKEAEHPAKNKEVIVRNLNLLEKKLEGRERQLDQVSKLPERRKRINLGWMEEIGNLPLGRWETREKVYNYWEGIHKKHKAVVKSFDEFNEKAQKVINDTSDKDLEDALEDTKKLYQGKFLDDSSIIPNYVLKLQPFMMQIEQNFPAALSLIGKFLELKGIAEDEDIVTFTPSSDEGMGRDAVSEGASVSGKEATEGEFMQARTGSTTYEGGKAVGGSGASASITINQEAKDIFDEVKQIKLTSKRNNAVTVDPIFWYKYNDDYEDISIPMANLREIRGILTGEYEGGKDSHQPLLNLLPTLKEKYGDEFMSWFEKWAENMALGRNKGPFYLPISPFIEDEYYKDINTANKIVEFGSKDKTTGFGVHELSTGAKNKKGTVLWQEFNNGKKGQESEKEITDNILDKTNNLTQEFLEVLTSLGKEINDSFDVYNEKATDTETDSKQVYGNLGAIKQISSQGVNRTLVPEMTKSWNKLMEAMYDYYIEPMSGKFFIQGKEKPRWATSNAWLNLSKMVKDKQGKLVSPIGSLLDKGMSDITVKDIEQLIKFMQMATRGNIIAEDNTLLSEARKTSKALDNMFGEQFSEKNKISVLNVVYEVMPSATLKGSPKAVRRFFKGLEDKDEIKSEYKSKKNFPIDMLRHAINLPEFTAFYGLSDYRAGAPKKESDIFGEKGGKTRAEKQRVVAMDEDMHNALLRLDKLFDSFYQMDDVNKSLLYAHDTIRKMQDKNIVKSYLSLTDVDQMGLVIDKIHKEHRMDLTATEIDKIVKAVSSYKSISSNYGINEEVVYKIKAMFR
tara:strand:+ start:1789 stop:4527 length:2739 start_codon:yes stop_codon:yes gene_type:complete